jgi:excisionase family DNA binding protein
MLGLHEKTVERLIRRGELVAYKPAGRVRIRCEDLFTFMDTVRVQCTRSSVSIHTLKRKRGNVYKVVWRDELLQQRSRTFSLKRDAEVWEARVKLSKRQGELAALDSGRQLLRDFASDWRALHGESHLAPKTLVLYDFLTDRLLPHLGHVPLRQLTTERIQRALADLLAAGVPPATVRKALTLLQGMLERAVQWGRIANNSARYVRKPPNPPKRMTQPLSPRQIESVRRTLSKRKRLRDATLVSVLAYAGLRPGEALALRWRDIRAVRPSSWTRRCRWVRREQPRRVGTAPCDSSLRWRRILRSGGWPPTARVMTT